MDKAANEQGTAMSDQITSKMDRLSSLPPELLRPIFRLAQEDGPQPLAPLNRLLLSLGREALLEHVVINKKEQVHPFVKAVNAGATGEYVKQLELRLIQESAEDEAEMDAEFVGSKGDEEALAKCFDQLDKLTQLTVQGSSRIAALTLSYRVARSCFPRLQCLTLAASFSDWPNPFNPEHYKHLGRWGGMTGLGLDSFDLTILRELHSITDTPPSSPLRPHVARAGSSDSTTSGERDADDQTVDAEKDLVDEETDERSEEACSTDSAEFGVELTPFTVARLAGPLSHPLAVELSDFTHNNVATIIVSTSPLLSFRPFLEPASCPEILRALALINSDDAGGSDPLDDLLLSFTQLEELELARGTFSPQIFTDVLPKLHLTRLGFGFKAEVTSQQLLDIIRGPRRLSTLRILCIDVVRGEKGTTLKEMGGMPCTTTEDGMYPDWELPEWPVGLSGFDVDKLIRVAEEQGVQVEGSVVEAMEVDAAHELEFEWVAEIMERWDDYEPDADDD